MWPSSPVPPCCSRVWCVAELRLATRLFLLSAEAGICSICNQDQYSACAHTQHGLNTPKNAHRKIHQTDSNQMHQVNHYASGFLANPVDLNLVGSLKVLGKMFCHFQGLESGWEMSLWTEVFESFGEDVLPFSRPWKWVRNESLNWGLWRFWGRCSAIFKALKVSEK